MAKDKTKSGVPNKHLHARISYLQQAATYLTLQGQGRPANNSYNGYRPLGANDGNGEASVPIGHAQNTEKAEVKPQDYGTNTDASHECAAQPPDHIKASSFAKLHTGGLPLHLTTHLCQTALKSQIRLHNNIKRSICKRCSTVLFEEETCTKRMENMSRGGRKPHADVLVLECGVCGAEKRFPVGAKRQRRKIERVREQGVGGVDLEGGERQAGGGAGGNAVAAADG